MTSLSSYGITKDGILRYGLNMANTAVVRRGADGAPHGVAIKVGTFVADRLNVAFKPVPYESTGAFTRSFGKEEWDITIVGTSPGAKTLFNFTPDLFLLDYVYLARPGCSFTDIYDVDRPGIKVGASPNGSGSQYLAANLKSAELILGAGDSDTITAMLRDGTIDVYGANVNNLLAVAERLPESSFVAGAFQTVHFAAALPKARPSGALHVLSELVLESRVSEIIAMSIENVGLKGMRIAP